MWRQRWFRAQRSFAHSTPASAAWPSLPGCALDREKVNNDNLSLVPAGEKPDLVEQLRKGHCAWNAEMLAPRWESPRPAAKKAGAKSK